MEEYLDLLSVVDILNWVRDNAGMNYALSIVVLAVLIAIPTWIICYFRKEKATVENQPTVPSVIPSQSVTPGALPNNSGTIIIGNNNSPVFHVNTPKEEKPVPEPPALPEHRAWRELMNGTERIEQAAGFRAAGPIYYTPGPYPRFYIMHASARVFRPGGEEYYDAKGETQYILLRHDAPGDMPYRVRPHGLTDLEALYKRAADSNACCD